MHHHHTRSIIVDLEGNLPFGQAIGVVADALAIEYLMLRQEEGIVGAAISIDGTCRYRLQAEKKQLRHAHDGT